MVSRSRICGARRKALSGLEGLLEIVSLEMTTTKVSGLLHIRYEELEGRVPDFRNCNAEAAGAK